MEGEGKGRPKIENGAPGVGRKSEPSSPENTEKEVLVGPVIHTNESRGTPSLVGLPVSYEEREVEERGTRIREMRSSGKRTKSRTKNEVEEGRKERRG